MPKLYVFPEFSVWMYVFKLWHHIPSIDVMIENPGNTRLEYFRSAQKNTNLIEGFDVLLPIKFRQNSFNSSGEKVEKCFSQSEARAAIFDFRSARKTQIDRGLWGIASCQVSSKSIQRLRRRRRKIFQSIRGQDGHLGFPIGTKTKNLIEGVEDLLPIMFRQNQFNGCGEECEKCFSQPKARASILDFRSARKTW